MNTSLVYTVLSAGVTNGQVEKLSCGQVCLSAQVTCICTVTGSFLEWRVRNTAGTPQGQETLIPSELGEVKTLPLAAFEALLTNATGGSLTAMLTFITLSDYEGFTIECETIGDLVDFTIAIPGIDW